MAATSRVAGLSVAVRWLVCLLALWLPCVPSQARSAAPATDIPALEQALAARPGNVEVMQALAAALLAQVRIEPRAEQLARAEVLLEQLLAVHAPRAEALDAWRLLILHRFEQALQAARRARTSNADALLAALSEADALTELGRYREAEQAVQALLDEHYGAAALSRASHLRRLFGDLPGALELAQAALRHGASAIDRAWLSLDIAELELLAGRPRVTLALATTAVTDMPAAALVMQARAQQALGAPRAALALYRVAAARSVRVETEVELLRLALELGETQLATATKRLLRGMHSLAPADGGGDRRAWVEFHLLNDELPAALTLARLEWQQRPDVHGAAQLAWVLWRAGQRDAACDFAARAIAEHSIDAVLQWRAGTVLTACGERRGADQVAAALRIQPWLADRAGLIAHQP